MKYFLVYLGLSVKTTVLTLVYFISGTKQSCPSVDNPAKMKATKEEEFRTSLFEKFQTSKTSSKDSTCNALSKDNAENDKGKSCNSALPINQACYSTPVKNIAGYGSNPALSNQKRVKNSTPVGDVAICKNASINCDTQSARRGLSDVNGMDCDETFHSATEEVDTSHYDTCHESLIDLSFTAQHKASSKGDFLDASLSGIRESNVHKESTTDKLQKGGNNNSVDNKECNETVSQIDNPLMLKAEESDVNMPEESENEDLDKDQKSSYNSSMEDEQVHDCDDLKREEPDKSCHQINKPCDVNGVLPVGSHSSNDCKEDANSDFFQKEECNPISKPFNEIRLDSDVLASDGDISEGSESDDDLLTPPRFLYEKLQLKPNVRTPEKGIVPAFFTPSPVTKDVVKEDKTKYKLSFEKLIKEKVKRTEKDAELAEMEAELQRGLEKGGIAQMQVPSSFSDIESEEELTDGIDQYIFIIMFCHYYLSGCKENHFTGCHLGKLKLAFTSPDVISTSPKSFFMSRIDFTVPLLFEFLKKHHLPIGQVKNRIHQSDSKIH